MYHSQNVSVTMLSWSATPKVKVFAWSPFGDQFFWLRETFLQIKSTASKF